jgi:mRNA interferase HigB
VSGGTDTVERYFAARAGHRGFKAARAQYDAWRAIAEQAQTSILRSGRVVFNIKANDYRLIAVMQYSNGILSIRFFGSHQEYDKVDAESV